MKNSILSLVLLLCVALSQNTLAQTLLTPDTSIPSERDEFIESFDLLQGPIKSFEEYAADIVLKFGEATIINEHLTQSKSFDIIGKEIVSSQYDDSGSLTEQTAYTRISNSDQQSFFDDQGTVLKRYDTDYDTSGERRIWTLFEGDSTTFTWQYTYTYAADDLPLSVTKFNPDGTIDVLASFDYDALGNKTTEAFYNASGEIYRLERFSYENDLLLEEAFYDGDNNLTSSTIFTHDDNGNVLSISKYDNNRDLVSLEGFEYDDDNNRVVEQDFDTDGELHQQTNFSFDERGNKLSESLFDAEGNQIWQKTFEYAANDLLVKQSYFNADGTIDRGFEFSYDNNDNLLETKNIIFGGAHYSTDVCEYKNLDTYGNWTERNCVLFKRVSGEFQADYGNSISEVTLRVIEYFE